MYFICMSETDHILLTDPDVPEQKRTKIRQKMEQRKQEEIADCQKEFEERRIVLWFQVCDAYYRPFRTIEIADTDGDNISFVDHRKKVITKRHLDRQTIDRIVEMIRKAGAVFQAEDFYIEDSGYFDGTIDRVFLSDRENGYRMDGDNLGHHDAESHPNVTVLIALLRDIFSLLSHLNVDKKFFKFGLCYYD